MTLLQNQLHGDNRVTELDTQYLSYQN